MFEAQPPTSPTSKSRSHRSRSQWLCGVIVATALAGNFAGPALAQDSDEDAMMPANGSATAVMHDLKGNPVGTVTLRQTPTGVLITADLKGLPPGVHGFHIHEKGVCEPPFKSAGGHFNPDGADHGYLSENGPEAGDLPNIHVPKSGTLVIEMHDPLISLKGEEAVLDADGAAIVIHSGADDYKTQPSGNSGDRIACGVIKG
jgi:Cu-Zn family superoxide dismutase